MLPTERRLDTLATSGLGEGSALDRRAGESGPVSISQARIVSTSLMKSCLPLM